MGATLNFDIPLSINELAELIRERLSAKDKLKLVQLLSIYEKSQKSNLDEVS